MPTKKVIDVISEARTILHDLGIDRYQNQELLQWFNAGQLAVVTVRPDARTVHEPYVCDLGTRQELPEAGVRFIRCDRNMGGPAIRYKNRDELDALIPDWHDDSDPTDECEFYVFDSKEPRVFYLYPAPQAGHLVEIAYGAAPEVVSITNFDGDRTEIGVEDTFSGALLDYILFRCFSKDADFAGAAQRAANHYAAFRDAISGKTNADAGMTPENG
jgi:hypothetical protein